MESAQHLGLAEHAGEEMAWWVRWAANRRLAASDARYGEGMSPNQTGLENCHTPKCDFPIAIEISPTN